MNLNKKFRWGIMGCAEIASRAVIRGFQESATGELAAIASRDAAKARAWAGKHGIPAAHAGYEALIADPGIDAVYIPLPNHLHREWTLRAIEAGKHVLCEKPFALNAREAAEMVGAGERSRVHVAEAFMYRHHPRYRRVREIVAAGEIGEIRGIHGTFTYNGAAKRTENVRWHRHMGGGSIYDIGCYPISAARLILGREPEAATVHAMFSPAHDGVDMMAAGILEFPGGIALTFDCGMWAAFRNTLEILGTEGSIGSTSAFNSPPDAPSHFFLVKGGERREIEVPPANQYALQADDFARAALKIAPAIVPPDDPIGNQRAVDACLASAGSRRRIELASLVPNPATQLRT